MKNLLYLLAFAFILTACTKKSDDPAPTASGGCFAPTAGMPKSISIRNTQGGIDTAVTLCYDNQGRFSGWKVSNDSTQITYGQNGKLYSMVVPGSSNNVKGILYFYYRWAQANLRSVKLVSTPQSIESVIYTYSSNGNVDNFIAYYKGSLPANIGEKYYYFTGQSNPFWSETVSSNDSGRTTLPIGNNYTFSYDSSNRLKQKKAVTLPDTGIKIAISYDNFTYNKYPKEFVIVTGNLIPTPFGYGSTPHYQGQGPFSYFAQDPSISIVNDYNSFSSNKCPFDTYKFLSKLKDPSGNLTSFRYVHATTDCSGQEVVLTDQTVTITY